MVFFNRINLLYFELKIIGILFVFVLIFFVNKLFNNLNNRGI